MRGQAPLIRQFDVPRTPLALLGMAPCLVPLQGAALRVPVYNALPCQRIIGPSSVSLLTHPWLSSAPFTHPPTTKFEADPPGSRTFARQHELPRLPIPSLEDTCRRYLTALEGLQDAKEHERTRRAVEEFLHHDGQKWQEQLKG